jgi:hypothetical protein
MTPSELYDRFRSDVVDVAKPYLWTEEEVWGYENAAYRMFVRLTGGVADFTSEACTLEMAVGERVVDLHPSILHIDDAYRLSDGGKISIVNLNDPQVTLRDDYGLYRKQMNTNVQGSVAMLVIGRQKHKGEWINTPAVVDQAQLSIYRLPLANVTESSAAFDGVDEDHHLYLLDWMKHLAYAKQDAETFDKTKSENARAMFEAYCAQVRREWARYQHKTRVVAYGGL